MADVKVGDTIYFSSVAILVNEGTVESIEGPYIKVKTKCPGVEYLMKSQVFSSKAELRGSQAYSSAWSAQNQRRRDQQMLTYMGNMSIF